MARIPVYLAHRGTTKAGYFWLARTEGAERQIKFFDRPSLVADCVTLDPTQAFGLWGRLWPCNCGRRILIAQEAYWPLCPALRYCVRRQSVGSLPGCSA
jgi:hypothetical protein